MSRCREFKLQVLDAPSVGIIRSETATMYVPRGRATERKRIFSDSQTVSKLTVPEKWLPRKITEPESRHSWGVKPAVDPRYMAGGIIPLGTAFDRAPRIRKPGDSETATMPRVKRYRTKRYRTKKPAVDSDYNAGLAGSIVPPGSKTPRSKYEVNNVPSAAAALEPEKGKPVASLAAAAAQPTKVKRIRIKFNGKETVRYLRKETLRQRLENFKEFREKVRDRDENLYRAFMQILKIYRTGDVSVEEIYGLASELFAEHYDLLEEFGWEYTSFLPPVLKRSLNNSQNPETEVGP